MTSNELFARHRGILELALSALATRGHLSIYSSDPEDCGEFAAREGRAAFENYCGSYFYLDQPGVGERIGEESSPYGVPLDIQYPKTNINTIIPAALRAKEAWNKEMIDARAGICMEILHQLQARSFELALASMYTTGAPFRLAFRLGASDAQERGLEALALTYQEMRSIPADVIWEGGQDAPERHLKRFRVSGLGVGLVIGCSTQPNWSAYPAIFANLMAGNAVLVKPHPLAVLPLAITVGVARHVLKEAGMDPNLVLLVVDEQSQPVAQTFSTRAEVGLVDYTGNSAFASWLTESAAQARLHLHRGAVNPVVIDGTDDPEGMAGNLARAVCDFGGRRCTAPRVVFSARSGPSVPGGRISTAQLDELVAQQFDRLLADLSQAAALLGAFREAEFAPRVLSAAATGELVVAPRVVVHPEYTEGVVITPAVVRVRPEQIEIYGQEWFGPILFMVECESITDAIERAALVSRSGGGLVASVYAMDAGVGAAAEEALGATGATVCVNLTSAVTANDSSAFSDFHGSGINIAASAVLTDARFVVDRFKVICSRSLVGDSVGGKAQELQGDRR